VPEEFPFATESVQLASQDWICTLTDGVTEAMNAQGELYGAHRLERALNTLSPQATPGDINAAVLADVKGFVGEAAASDDLTLLTLRWTSAR
jgi:serine phosphatase RsbU (regulator of sigma subunit)